MRRLLLNLIAVARHAARPSVGTTSAPPARVEIIFGDTPLPR